MYENILFYRRSIFYLMFVHSNNKKVELKRVLFKSMQSVYIDQSNLTWRSGYNLLYQSIIGIRQPLTKLQNWMRPRIIEYMFRKYCFHFYSQSTDVSVRKLKKYKSSKWICIYGFLLKGIRHDEYLLPWTVESQ